MSETQELEEKLDVITDLLRQLLAVKLAEKGLTQEAIGKRLHVAKASVVSMLKDIKRE
jgi:predicted transcriptional regulator